MSTNNFIQIVHKYLSALDIKVSFKYLETQLKIHPDFPSLASVTDVFDELDIENLSLVVDKEKLGGLPTPFMIHSSRNGGEFVIISNVDNQLRKGNDLEKGWDGIVLLAEKPEGWHHAENTRLLVEEKTSRIRITLMLTLIIGLAVFSLLNYFSFSRAGLLLASLTGLGLAILIVQQKLGISNEFTEQLCNTNSETDCNAVLHSNGGNLTNWFNWSDAGIIYFTSLLLLPITQPENSILALIAAATIPFVLYSVYYQWQVIKKWCTLCILTLTVLLTQFIILLPDLLQINFNSLSVSHIAFPAFIFSAIGTVWLLFIWPLLQKDKELKDQNSALQRFKNNPEVFNALLEKEKRIELIPEHLGIILGNGEATNTIIKVCNPYCNPCAKAHIKMDELLARNNNLKVQILFNASDDENDIKSKPVRHFLALQESNNSEMLQHALDDWYLADEKDYAVFASKYRLNGELNNQGDKIKLMKAWCDEINIEYTPTFFINGHQLPKLYKIEDLKYFMKKN